MKKLLLVYLTTMLAAMALPALASANNAQVDRRLVPFEVPGQAACFIKKEGGVTSKILINMVQADSSVHYDVDAESTNVWLSTDVKGTLKIFNDSENNKLVLHAVGGPSAGPWVGMDGKVVYNTVDPSQPLKLSDINHLALYNNSHIQQSGHIISLDGDYHYAGSQSACF